MKSTYLFLIALIIVIIGVIWLHGKPKQAVAPETTTQKTETPAQEQQASTSKPESDSMNMTPEEHAAMMGESSKGSDVGMEMPMDDSKTAPKTTATTKSSEKMFMVHAKNFEFDTKEIRVKKGDTVMIHFMSTDGFHDWVIDAFNAHTERVKTGGMSSVTFVADKTGTFEYYCSVGSHRSMGMVGKLIVE